MKRRDKSPAHLEARAVRLDLRLSESERAELAAAANDADLALATWARRVLLRAARGELARWAREQGADT